MTHHDIILRPVATEKTAGLASKNKVVFRVRKDATKYQIRAAVEALFDVKVTSVNTMVMPGKPKRAGRYMTRTAGFKKAIVTLADGESIALFEDDLLDDDFEFSDEDFDFGDEEEEAEDQ